MNKGLYDNVMCNNTYKVEGKDGVIYGYCSRYLYQMYGVHIYTLNDRLVTVVLTKAGIHGSMCIE